MSRPHTGNRDSAQPENSAELFLRRRENQVAEQTIWNNRGHLNVFTDWCADRGVTDLAQLDGVSNNIGTLEQVRFEVTQGDWHTGIVPGRCDMLCGEDSIQICLNKNRIWQSAHLYYCD